MVPRDAKFKIKCTWLMLYKNHNLRDYHAIDVFSNSFPTRAIWNFWCSVAHDMGKKSKWSIHGQKISDLKTKTIRSRFLVHDNTHWAWARDRVFEKYSHIFRDVKSWQKEKKSFHFKVTLCLYNVYAYHKRLTIIIIIIMENSYSFPN
jgi:hypothetical protein